MHLAVYIKERTTLKRSLLMEKEGKEMILQYWGMKEVRQDNMRAKELTLTGKMQRVRSFYICAYKLTCTFMCTHIFIHM